ncbi:MAG: NFACT RNA binding domain-containing protein [Bernardetiaceae bacterium]
MHNNFYFLRHLAQQLDRQLTGYRIVQCFCQDKDELIFGLTNDQDECWIRATLTAQLQCLSFPEDFFRARRNSVDLFKPLIGKTVLRVRVAPNERCLFVELGQGLLLAFKLHGRQANVLLFAEKKVIEIFHQRLIQDYDYSPEMLQRPIDQSKAAFLQQGITDTFPTFGRELREELCTEATPEAQWQRVQEVLATFGAGEIFVFRRAHELPQLSLLPPPPETELLLHTRDALAALNTFYGAWQQQFFLEQEKKSALRILDKRYRQTAAYLQKAQQKYDDLQHSRPYEEIANLIMANLHQIPKEATSIEVFDFYKDTTTTIKLKKELSAADNAALYYRKTKNQHLEQNTLTQHIENKTALLKTLDQQREQIKAFDRLKALRQFLKTSGIQHEQSQRKGDTSAPFREFLFKGYTIWVGRNSQNNDLLTQRYAHKDDLWLHARDVGGSHVVVRHIGKAPFPQDVIERAAQLAAYYSKRKSEGICPVIYTPKKYVRKPKGAAAGAVVVERETIVMVEPKL